MGKLGPTYSLQDGRARGRSAQRTAWGRGQGTRKLCPTYSLQEEPRRGGPGGRGPRQAPGISECNVRGEAPKGRQQVT